MQNVSWKQALIVGAGECCGPRISELQGAALDSRVDWCLEGNEEWIQRNSSLGPWEPTIL